MMARLRAIILSSLAILVSASQCGAQSGGEARASKPEISIETYCGYFGEQAAELLQSHKTWDAQRAPSASEFKEFSSRLSEAFTLVQKYASTEQVGFDDIRLAAVPSSAAGKETKGKEGRPGKRLILINNNFMESIFAYALSDRLNRNTRTGELLSGQRYDWPLITVIAHHFAYHLYGDSFGSGCNPRNVLRSDWQSGNLLRQMQAPLSQVSYLIHQFAPVCGTKTHPSREERLLAVVAGYRQACEKDKNCNATAVLEDLNYLLTERPAKDCDGSKRTATVQRDYGLICKISGQELLVDLPASMSPRPSGAKQSTSKIGTIYRRRTIVPSDAPEVIGQFIHTPNPSDGSQATDVSLGQCNGLMVLEQSTWHDMAGASRASSSKCGPTSALPAAMACYQADGAGGKLLDFTGRAKGDECRTEKSNVIGTCRRFQRILKPPKFETLCSVGGRQYLVDEKKHVYDRRLLEPGVRAKFVGTLTGKESIEPSLCGQTMEIPWETVCVRTENPFAKNALRCDPKSTYRMRSLCLNKKLDPRTQKLNTNVSVRRDGNVVVGACVSCRDNPLCPGRS